MTHFLKAGILALGLILLPATTAAQEALPEAPNVTPAEQSTSAEAPAAGEAEEAKPQGLDPALYTPMKPTPGKGMPVDGGIDFQDQYSEVGHDAKWINDVILVPMMAVVSLFVLFLLLVAVVRFRQGANPEPSKTTHNTFIEIVWTVIPIIILVIIAVPSISLVAKQFEPAPEDALTVKVTGYQWYWTYNYPDNGDFEIISNMLPEEEAKARGEPFQLAVDNRMVIPVGKPVKVLVTAADVIHSFAIPAAWFKIDAVPGRINEMVLQIDEPGVYYGQCSELCGARHGFMPITVEVLPEDKFDDWVRANGGKPKTELEAEAVAEAEAAAADTAASEGAAEEVTAAANDNATDTAPADAAAATE